MSLSTALTRGAFLLLSLFIPLKYFFSLEGTTNYWLLIGGIWLSLALGLFLADVLTRHVKIQTLSQVAVGFITGIILSASISTLSYAIFGHPFLQESIYLITTYLCIRVAFRSPPLFTQTAMPSTSTPSQARFLLDNSALEDSRFIELASFGLFDQQLAIPQFIVDHLRKTSAVDSQDSNTIRAKRAEDQLEKLRSIPSVNLLVDHTDYTDISEISQKLERLAKEKGYKLLTAHKSVTTSTESSSSQGLDLHTLANVLKPLMQSGSTLEIKIQMYGKQPRQGVGFLDDGTMVVVNGGSEYIGQTINAYVLSEKPTSSGRMIFCNVVDDSTHRYNNRHSTEDTIPSNPSSPRHSS